MKATEPEIIRALDRADPAVRLFFLYGPDEAGLQQLAARLAKALGEDAERIDLEGAQLKGDPARLADEAGALSLFGGRRWIRVTGGDECAGAVDALLALDSQTEPVVLIAPALKGTSALVKRALADRSVLAYQGYKLEGGRAEAQAVQIGRELGLKIDPRLARQLVEACANDRALLARECEKFALYLDAAPDRPRELTSDIFEMLSADAAEASLFALVDAMFDGEPGRVISELRTIGDAGSAIPILRMAARRALLLAGLRAKVEAGRSPAAVMASDARYLKGKEESAVARQLARWPAPRLAIVANRLFQAEESLKHGQAGAVIAEQELLAIARVGQSLR